MKRVEAILAACMAISLTGCVLRGKTPAANAVPPPKPAAVAAPAPAPPPQPLSVPQTSVQLPPAQPLTPEAIASTQPPEEPPAPPAVPRSTPRRSPPTRAETTPQGPAAPIVPPEPERPPIQEALPAAEMKRLQDEADAAKREIVHRIEQVQLHRLTRQQSSLVSRIRSFVKQSDDAEKRGDMRQASELAQRALVLARDLQP
jgi:hypothetical protein